MLGAIITYTLFFTLMFAILVVVGLIGYASVKGGK